MRRSYLFYCTCGRWPFWLDICLLAYALFCHIWCTCGLSCLVAVACLWLVVPPLLRCGLGLLTSPILLWLPLTAPCNCFDCSLTASPCLISFLASSRVSLAFICSFWETVESRMPTTIRSLNISAFREPYSQLSIKP